MAGDVFISYSSKEADTAKLVRKTLKDNGISVWMAPESIPSGSNYAIEIPKGIMECKVFLLILSNKSQESKWVPREVDEAINNEKLIIPFQIEDCKLNDLFNFYLNQVQRIKAYLELEGSLNKLVKKIKRLTKSTEEKSTDENTDNEIVYPNGDIYIGEIKDDKRNGKGKMEYSNGDVYEGLWKDSLKEGKGKMTYPDGSYFEGTYIDNKRWLGTYYDSKTEKKKNGNTEKRLKIWIKYYEDITLEENYKK